MCDALQLNWKLNNSSKGSSTSAMNSSSSSTSNSSSSTAKKPSKADKYGLRAASVNKRAEKESKKDGTRKKRGPKPRPKSAPMSKYRRKTANLRERQRMGEINTAFERLRDRIPNPVMLSGRGRCEKLTKINILHVTINYIRAMENLLSTGDSGVRSYSEMVRNPIRPEERRHCKFEQYDDEIASGIEAGAEDPNSVVANANANSGSGGGGSSNGEVKGGSKKKSKKGAKKARDKSNASGPTAPLQQQQQPQQQQQQQQFQQQRLLSTSMSSLQQAPRSLTSFSFSSSSSSTNLTSMFSNSIKSCMETSSDSGLSSASSSSVSPSSSFSSSAEDLKDHNHRGDNKTMLDPLLASSAQQKSKIGSHSLSSNKMMPFDDAVDQDEMLREVVGLVDSLQDDFPAIAFDDDDDPFGEWMMLPKAM